MIPVYIGWDAKETLAWHVLASSIIVRTDSPVALTPIGIRTLSSKIWKRERGPLDSTDFSNARFMVPFLQEYHGWAIFMDCDMVCGEDIERLWAQRDEAYAVMCVKHKHIPREKRKFLDQIQTPYSRKNWSSLMLLNCAHPATRRLTAQYVNTAPGLDLHGMVWAEEQIGEIQGPWNVLSTSGVSLEHPTYEAGFPIALLHYTRGGPWHGMFTAGQNAWLDELAKMAAGENPCADFKMQIDPEDRAFVIAARYGQEPHEA